MWSNKYVAVAPVRFREVFVKKYKIFGGTEHQDSHEFLTTLIDNLHEDLNLAKHSKYRERGASFDHLNAHDRAIRAVEEYKLSNCSPLMDIFLGQTRSTVTCAACGHCNPNFENSWQITLSLPPPSIFLNVKVFPLDSRSVPVVFGFWVFKNPEIETITSAVVDMVAEQYGRDVQAQNIILCTMAQDGSQAISDVCYSNASLKHLCGGEMIYAFEMDDSVYKGPKWNPASPMLFKEGDGVDSPGAKHKFDYAGTFVPFAHRVYNSDGRGKYSVIGRPGLIFVPSNCNTAEFSILVCTEVLKSVDIDMMRGKSSNNRDSSAATPPLFDGNDRAYLDKILQEYGILRIVSTSSLHWRKGSDVPESDENVHTWLPYRKMHVTFDWYEDSIYDETAASAVDLHTTFTHRPDFEDSKIPFPCKIVSASIRKLKI